MTTPRHAIWHFLRPVLASCWLYLPPVSAYAQATSPGASPPAPKPGEAPMQLSEFVVSDSQDRGYTSTNAMGVTRTNTPLIDIPQMVNVLNKEFLEDTQAGELYDALKYVSGISIQSNVGDSVMIRGYTVRGNHTDGLSDNQNQTQMGSEPFQFERLEVLKGPSALVYGSHAIGGVLNRVRKTPQWKSAGIAALTLGNHGQRKAELDYTAPLSSQLAYRLIAVRREEDLVNGVSVRHAFAERWNIIPMLTWRPRPNLQVRFSGDFMHEEAFKHWGDNAQLQPFVKDGPTTFGLVPRDFTFSDEQSQGDNDKAAAWLSIEAEITPDWSLRLASYFNAWDHGVTDILPAGMQANNRLMNRTWRYISNDDYDFTTALDSIFDFRVGPTDHKFLTILQRRESWNYSHRINAANPPPLDILAPVYGYVGPVNPVLNMRTYGEGESRSISFQDQAKLLEDRLHLVAGARFDWFNSRTDNRLTGVRGSQNKGDNWTYKGGVVFKPIKPVSLFYNYAETFSPNFGANPDGTTFRSQIGEINEVGVKTALRDGRINATLAYYDLVLLNILTADPDPTRASAGWRVQNARQETKGFEADLSLILTPNWELMLSGAAMDISLPSGLLPDNAPEKTASAWTRYKFTAGPLKGLALGGGWTWHDEAAADAGNLVFFDAFSTIDVFAQYSWKKYKFALNVSNLADEWYLARGINRNIFFAGPERLVKLRVSYAF